MATEVKMRRGTCAEHKDYTGWAGEVTIDTTNLTARVHDGVTPGGAEACGEIVELRMRGSHGRLFVHGRRLNSPIVLPRLGTRDENGSFIGADGEMTVDSFSGEVHFHDGKAAGGSIIPGIRFLMPDTEGLPDGDRD